MDQLETSKALVTAIKRAYPKSHVDLECTGGGHFAACAEGRSGHTLLATGGDDVDDDYSPERAAGLCIRDADGYGVEVLNGTIEQVAWLFALIESNVRKGN